MLSQPLDASSEPGPGTTLPLPLHVALALSQFSSAVHSAEKSCELFTQSIMDSMLQNYFEGATPVKTRTEGYKGCSLGTRKYGFRLVRTASLLMRWCDPPPLNRRKKKSSLLLISS